MRTEVKQVREHCFSHTLSNCVQSPSGALLDVHKRNSKAYRVYDLVTNGSFRDGVEEILSVLKVFSDAVTFLEEDTTPASMPPKAVAAVVKEVKMTARDDVSARVYQQVKDAGKLSRVP
jgi:hypothetical protein